MAYKPKENDEYHLFLRQNKTGGLVTVAATPSLRKLLSDLSILAGTQDVREIAR